MWAHMYRDTFFLCGCLWGGRAWPAWLGCRAGARACGPVGCAWASVALVCWGAVGAGPGSLGTWRLVGWACVCPPVLVSWVWLCAWWSGASGVLMCSLDSSTYFSLRVVCNEIGLTYFYPYFYPYFCKFEGGRRVQRNVADICLPLY